MLNSLMVRREFASTLSHYRPDRLAQTVFATTTFLKRHLDKFRHLHAQVEAKHRTAVQVMLDSQTETVRVKADYATLHEFYWGEARRLQMLLDAADHRRHDHLRGVMAEHDLEKRALQEEISELRSRVDSLFLTSRGRRGTRCLEVPRLMNFLNRKQTRINDNWGRLQSLFERFRDYAFIAVTAVDDPFAQSVPFTTLPEDDSDGETKDDRGDQGGHIQGGDNTINLTQPGSDCPLKKQSQHESVLKVPESPQLRPTGWKPTKDGSRSPSDRLMFSEAHVRDTMKNQPVIWDTLRPDVNGLMQAEISYQGAIAMLSEDIMVHNLFPPAALAAILTNRMFWNRLDESLWS
ncbi:LOW QUALITY PROTEIN: hypothetical protein PHMEG_00012148 [Phytophthora megakarya]|uniref:Uncharacterized protein n=1 Tax=Phytophthora megakarya TaxID=4795 RepID=A0A225WAY0_9STRA|nr:LOW QUALITY PROTEIN: hypothetical protein PHMEG_00012148 [Phytophthora megakarya]